MNGPAYFEIQADDPDKTQQFYAAIFGWTFIKDESLPIDYRRITTEGLNGGLLRRPAKLPAIPNGTNAFVCSMEVKDFDATASKILAMGGKVTLDRFAVPGKCWQGYFLDPQGNTFGLFQVDTNAA